MIVTSGIGFLNSCVVMNRSSSQNTGRNITTWLLLDSLFETTRVVYVFVCEIMLKGKGPMQLYELLISAAQYRKFPFLCCPCILCHMLPSGNQSVVRDVTLNCPVSAPFDPSNNPVIVIHFAELVRYIRLDLSLCVSILIRSSFKCYHSNNLAQRQRMWPVVHWEWIYITHQYLASLILVFPDIMAVFLWRRPQPCPSLLDMTHNNIIEGRVRSKSWKIIGNHISVVHYKTNK